MVCVYACEIQIEIETERENLVAVHFTDMVNSAGMSQIDYNKSLYDLVVTKRYKTYCKIIKYF